MINASSWTLQYLVVVLFVLLVGPALSKLPAAQAVSLTLFGLDSAQTVRLIVEGSGLATLCILSLRGYRRMPDNGQGFSFIRTLILPLTAIFVLIATDKTLRMAGLSLIEQIGSQHYALAYTASLTLTALWATAAWLLNFDALHRFFSVSTPEEDGDESTLTAEEHGEVQPDQSSGEIEAGTAILNANKNPPSTLGRYRILRELGRGAMGVVYLGKDPTIQRFVAIKTMRFDKIDADDKLQEIKTRFFREAESTGRLSHPNIVTIYDAGEEDHLVYIAMELLQGSTLKEWSHPHNLMPVSKLIPILATVADAMDYAHRQGVVHRDIKPANIMLTADHVVKVMDFGIATMASSARTKTETVLGTPTYMSPEQIAGKKVDGRSDIYSLGIVMFELLTGHPPFKADNLSALLYAITHTPPLRLSAVRADLPPLIQDVLTCALQKDPVRRYRTGGEFAQALRSVVERIAA
ncbi:MAG: serine/threonine protein kinase [Nitrospira sp.]|nr:serine/threonine protein kinase [Nitrospira sp.]MBH0183880.1 serine/threonine protein kinase [Nitrospira sp.]